MQRFLHAILFVFILQVTSSSASDDAAMLQIVNASNSGGEAPTSGRIQNYYYNARGAVTGVPGLLVQLKCNAGEIPVTCKTVLSQSRVQESGHESAPCGCGQQTLAGNCQLLLTEALYAPRAHTRGALTAGSSTSAALDGHCRDFFEKKEHNGCAGDCGDNVDQVTPRRNAAGNANLDWTDGVRDGQYTEPNQQGDGFNVYVADTGVNCYHTDLIGRCEKVNDQFDSNRGPNCKGRSRRCASDKHGHGTHCAGTVAGTAVGVARGARIGAVKVLSDSGSGSTAGVINGINAAVTHCGSGNKCVLSMSLGGPGTSNSYVDAIDAALAAGVITVVAAGNSNDDACNYRPAHVPSAVTVGSTADTGSTTTVTMSYFSNYGTCIDVWAVGSSVNSLSYNSKTSNATMSGTSMACPAVAGAMAVILGWGYSGQNAIDYMTNTALSGIINSIPSSPPSPNLHMRLVQPSR